MPSVPVIPFQVLCLKIILQSETRNKPGIFINNIASLAQTGTFPTPPSIVQTKRSNQV